MDGHQYGHSFPLCTYKVVSLNYHRNDPLDMSSLANIPNLTRLWWIPFSYYSSEGLANISSVRLTNEDARLSGRLYLISPYTRVEKLFGLLYCNSPYLRYLPFKM